MKRRNFLNSSGTALGLGIIAQALDGCSPTSVNPKPSANFTVDLTSSTSSTLNTVGGVLLTHGIFIIRTGQSSYIALSQICTHAGCHVNFNSSSKQFVCPCHGGTYDINGKVISEPPPSPFAQY